MNNTKEMATSSPAMTGLLHVPGGTHSAGPSVFPGVLPADRHRAALPGTAPLPGVGWPFAAGHAPGVPAGRALRALNPAIPMVLVRPSNQLSGLMWLNRSTQAIPTFGILTPFFPHRGDQNQIMPNVPEVGMNRMIKSHLRYTTCPPSAMNGRFRYIVYAI